MIGAGYTGLPYIDIMLPSTAYHFSFCIAVCFSDLFGYISSYLLLFCPFLLWILWVVRDGVHTAAACSQD
jgi:hypothetical protein